MSLDSVSRIAQSVESDEKKTSSDCTGEKVMTISFEIPKAMEQQIRTNGVDLNHEAKVVYLVDLYRHERITRDDLSEALGLGFHQTEQLLKDHGVGDDFTFEEFQAERALLRETGR
jgi:predicted HTH domain antitoxin